MYEEKEENRWVSFARRSQDLYSKPTFPAFSLMKPLLYVAFIALLCASTVVFVLKNNQRMASYEDEIKSLRSSLHASSNQLNDRMKREVSDTVQQEIESHISKRNVKNDSDQQEIRYVDPPKNKNAIGGVTYVRWGRRDCPSGENTKFVYTGYIAGGHYTHTGSGSNYLCLHRDVTYTPGRYVNGNQGSSYIYGAEFRDASWVYQLFDLSLTETNALQFHSVPCALCMAESKFTKVMIPGRETCPEDWTMEYTGYVMAAGHSDKHSTRYICVDDHPQIVPGTIGDQQGVALYMVETQCASLLCEPFVAGRELRCVVCVI